MCIAWYYYTKGVTPNPPGLAYKQTTCSYDAFLRGPNQKIISFSFYVNVETDRTKNKGYFDGIIGNLALMPKLYPGWTMRLYYDLDKQDSILKNLCDLACHDNNIDICDIKNLPGTPFVSHVFLDWLLLLNSDESKPSWLEAYLELKAMKSPDNTDFGELKIHTMLSETK